MYIRLIPGEQFDPDDSLYLPGRVYKAAMPIPLEYRELRYILPQMSGRAWQIYCILRYLEQIKFEKVTPTIDEIYNDWFTECMTKEEYDTGLKELQDFLVEDKQLDTIQPLLKFEKKRS